MSRYRGPRLRIIRRLGTLPGLTKKTTSRNTGPGQHGTSQKKLSQYGIRLQEKQKIRYNYGITERQFIRYVHIARKLKGSTGERLLQLLEMRFDNIIFRLGLAPTIPTARQLITHGHFQINNQKITIPSYQCTIKDCITVSSRISSKKIISNFLKDLKNFSLPSHLSLDTLNIIGKINSFVKRQEIGITINELLIIEYYSRKI